MKYQYFIWRNKWYPNEVRLFRYEEFDEKAKVLLVFYGESYKRGFLNNSLPVESKLHTTGSLSLTS